MKKGDFLSDEEKKKHSFGSKIKDVVVCRLSKGVAIGLASMALVAGGLSLAGCGGPTEVVTPPDPVVVPTEKIDAVLDDMELGNYTYSQKTGQETVNYMLDDGVLHTRVDDSEKYYYTVNGEAFNLTYDSTDNLWHKTEASKMDLDSIIFDDLSAATWSAYDEEAKEFSGKMNGENITLAITSGGSVTLQGENFEGEISNIGQTNVNLPDNSLIVDEVNPELPIEKITEFLSTLEAGNYSYSELVDGVAKNYYLDGDVWQIYKGSDDRYGQYYFVEEGKPYLLNFDTTDNLWHKEETELKDSKELIYNDLLNANWISYDRSNDEFTGVVDGRELYFALTRNGATLYGENYQKTLFDVGKTAVDLPDASKIAEDSVIVTPPPVVETDKIYTIDENGNYVFNVPAMVDVLKQKTQDGDLWISKYYNELYVFSSQDVTDVIYINTTGTDLEIGLLMKNNGLDVEQFGTMVSKDNSWAQFIENEENNSIDKFKEYIETSSKSFKYENPITYEYNTKDASTEQLAEFKTMTENILTKIATIGIQLTSVNKPGVDPIPEYENAKVLFGFKTPASSIGIGADLGNKRTWRHYYLLDVNGQLEFSSIELSSSVDRVENEKENVLNGNDNGYVVQYVGREKINNENKLLFEDNIEETKTDVYYMTDKEREL